MPQTAMPLVLVFMTFVSLVVGIHLLIKGHLFVPGTAVAGVNAVILTYLASPVFGRDNLVSPCIASLSAVALIWASIYCSRGAHRQPALHLLCSSTWAMLCATVGGAYWIDYFHSGQRPAKIAEVVTTGSWYIAQALLVATIIAGLIAITKAPQQGPQNNKRRRKP